MNQYAETLDQALKRAEDRITRDNCQMWIVKDEFGYYALDELSIALDDTRERVD